MPATAFTSPIKTNMMAMTLVAIEALTGSFLSVVPLDNHLLRLLKGNTLSPPIACNVRGAIIKEPRADEMVAAANPIGIMGPHNAILLIMS